MPLSLPTLKMLNTHLNGLGNAVKSAGPSLFSATQTPGPGAVQDTSMMMDAHDTSLNPNMSWQDTGLNAQNLGSLNPAMPSLSGPQNPYYNMGQQGGAMGNGTVGSFGGGLSALNAYDAAFAQAGAEQAIDPNWLKALAAEEGGWGAGAESGAGALGIMQIMPGGYGNLEAMYPGWQTDPTQNIRLGAAILKAKMAENGGSLEMGTQRYLGTGTDPYTGISTGQYLSSIQNYYQQLQQNGGQFSSGGGSVAPINGQWGGNAVGNSFVDQALKFQGVSYVWGSIPGAGQDPWQTGWDCSGFTYYMNQNYGDKSLPMGSHYQYQYAQQTGKLFTDLSQLQPGDLVFINTGWQGGAGAELNQAGHVGIYIGNGQMIHAANPSTGTIVSPLSGYGNILGGMHQGASSGGAGMWGGQQQSFGQSQSSGMGRISDVIGRFYAGYR